MAVNLTEVAVPEIRRGLPSLGGRGRGRGSNNPRNFLSSARGHPHPASPIEGGGVPFGTDRLQAAVFRMEKHLYGLFRPAGTTQFSRHFLS